MNAQGVMEAWGVTPDEDGLLVQFDAYDLAVYRELQSGWKTKTLRNTNRTALQRGIRRPVLTGGHPTRREPI